MSKVGIILSVLVIFSLLSLATLTNITSEASTGYFTTSSQWLVSPPYVVPGEKLVPLQVTLVYHGYTNITNVQIYPVESSPFIVTSNTQTYSFPIIVPGQEYTLTFIGNITPNIPLGVYNFYIQIYYTANGVEQVQEVTVQIPIMGYLQFYAQSLVSGIVFPGEHDLPITLTIFNTGNANAYNVTLFANNTYPIDFITKVAHIPIIQAGSSYSVQLLANIYNNASIGTYYIPLTILAYEKYYSLNLSISIDSNQSVEGEILNTNVILSEGPNSNGVSFQLSLIYTGPVDIQSYSVELLLPKGITNVTGGNTIYYFGGLLQPESEVFIPINININNVSLGSYSIPVKIVWNAIEGEGSVVSIVQYLSFSLTLLGSSNIQVVPSVSLLYAGTVNNISLNIRNTGNGNIYNLSITPLTSVSILNTLPKIPLLKPNQSVSVPLEIYVPSSLEGGSIQLSITIDYLNSIYQQSQYQGQIGFYVTQIAPSNPIIVSLNETQIIPGEFNGDDIILVNTLNETLHNISVILTSPLYLNTTLFNIPTLKPNSQYNIPITLLSQNSGIYSISVSITFYQENIQRQEELSIPIYVEQTNSPSIPILISLNTSTILEGQTQYLDLEISNILNEPLYNVTVSLSTQGQIYLNNTNIIIPFLKPLQTLEFPIQVYTSTSGIVSLQATITYYQDGQLKTSNELINTLSAGSVDIVITGISSVPTIATRGGIVSITATIYNFGTGPANGLTVTVYPPRGIQVIGENTYYIGNLGSDTSSTFTFAFRILNSTAPGRYTIPIVYTYTNNIGQVIHSYSNITLTIANSSGFFRTTSAKDRGIGINLPLIVILAIIVIIVIVIAIYLLRVRR